MMGMIITEDAWPERKNAKNIDGVDDVDINDSTGKNN